MPRILTPKPLSSKIVRPSYKDAPGESSVYDEIWVREPRLMVPRSGPLGRVKIDGNNQWVGNTANTLVSIYNGEQDFSGLSPGMSGGYLVKGGIVPRLSMANAVAATRCPAGKGPGNYGYHSCTATWFLSPVLWSFLHFGVCFVSQLTAGDQYILDSAVKVNSGGNFVMYDQAGVYQDTGVAVPLNTVMYLALVFAPANAANVTRYLYMNGSLIASNTALQSGNFYYRDWNAKYRAGSNPQYAWFTFGGYIRNTIRTNQLEAAAISLTIDPYQVVTIPA